MQRIIDHIETELAGKFPGENPLTLLAHLSQEIIELAHEVTQGCTAKIATEFADCFILLMKTATRLGMDAAMIETFVKLKVTIVKDRKYGPPNELGVRHHIEG